MTSPLNGARAYRLTSIDLLRGLVIVIMAIDHVRDYFLMNTAQDPTSDPNIGLALFLTRWITHFCAPTFVLLAGVSAGLMASRRTSTELFRFLLTRGLWLVFVEIAIISTAFTFSPRGTAQVGGLTLVPMQVIWAIGASMMVLAAVQLLGRKACLVLGGAIILFHNLLDPIWPAAQMLGGSWPLWVALHAQMSVASGPFLFLFAYPVLPWIGVMLAGFGLSLVFDLPAERRNRLLIRGGVALTVAFLALRALGIYGDPNPWQQQPAGALSTLIDFLNVSKYPPSLLFLLMTLGPAAIFCGLADQLAQPEATQGSMLGRLKRVLIHFGRAPFAFYVAHFFLIHGLSVVLGLAQGFTLDQMMTIMLFYPKGFGVSLPVMYVIWIGIVASLYPLCRWVSEVKARRRDWWLSYL